MRFIQGFIEYKKTHLFALPFALALSHSLCYNFFWQMNVQKQKNECSK